MNHVLRGTAPRAGVAPGGIAWAPLAITALGAAAAAYVAVTMPDLYRATLAGAIGVNLIVLGMRWPRAAAVATLLFVPFLALIRRLLISDTGWVANDPLLLVGPIVAIFLLYRLYILEDRGFDRDLLARLVLLLLGFVVIEAFNPTGAGGLIASLGGLIFLGVPLLWFFIGRQVGDRTISVLLYAVLIVAILVAAYGLFQTELA